jgi:hypothetical protein
VTIVAGGVSFLPIIIAGSVTAMEIAVGEVYARHLNVADVFLEGVAWTANSPAAGRIAWSTGTVVHNGNRYTLTAGNTPVGHTVVWWDQSSPTAFQTGVDMDAVAAAGFSDVSGDRVIALNDAGTPLVVWNGTRIYGGHLTTNIIKAMHIASITMEVGKYIESSNFVTGVSGWRLDDDSAELVDVTIRGLLESINYDPGVAGWHLDPDGSAEFNDGTFRGTVAAEAVIATGNFTALVATFDTIEVNTILIGGGVYEIFFGANNSGGSGFRMLRVLNT